MTSLSKKKVCLVGAGRVGLPLALVLSINHDVTCVERNSLIGESVKSGKMPFYEPGFDDELKAGALKFISSIDEFELDVDNPIHYVITIGTPLLKNIEPHLEPLDFLIQKIAKLLKIGDHISLRSTVAPGTNILLRDTIEGLTGFKIGKDIFYSYCPERLSEGQAKKELFELPQIVGVQDDASFEECKSLYQYCLKLKRHDIETAELIKLFTNSYRYANFALVNQFVMIAEEKGKNIFEIIESANEDYPRNHIPAPGLTAGTCLRKDFGFLSYENRNVDIFLSSWRINENLPLFLISCLKKRGLKRKSKVLMLGLTFKRDCDDLRDSLAIKMNNQLKMIGCIVDVYEPMIESDIHDSLESEYSKDLIPNLNRVYAVNNDYDFVIIGAPHKDVIDVLTERKLLLSRRKTKATCCDIWNCIKKNDLFYEI